MVQRENAKRQINFRMRGVSSVETLGSTRPQTSSLSHPPFHILRENICPFICHVNQRLVRKIAETLVGYYRQTSKQTIDEMLSALSIYTVLLLMNARTISTPVECHGLVYDIFTSGCF